LPDPVFNINLAACPLSNEKEDDAMFLLTESQNPFDYMSDLWVVLIVLLLLSAVLVLVGRPLHKYYTDRKTQAIIKESGAADVPAVKETPEDDEEDDGVRDGQDDGDEDDGGEKEEA
jgi:hypothetical protein